MDTRINMVLAAEHMADHLRAAEHLNHDGTARNGRFVRNATIALRLAGPADRGTVEHLAALDSAEAPQGDVLLAELDGEPVAALSLDDGQVVATPMVATTDAVALLRLRAGHLDERPAGWRRRLRPRLRAA